MCYTYSGHVQTEGKGYKINEILLADYGVNPYSQSIFTHERLIEENPDLVRRFMNATMQGWEYSINHPDEMVDILIKYNPELNATEERMRWDALVPLLYSAETEQFGIGYQTLARWENTQDLLYDLEIIDKKIDVNEVYTNDFLPE